MHINKSEADFITMLSFQAIHEIWKATVGPNSSEFGLMLWTPKHLSRKLLHMLLCELWDRTTSTACKDTSPLRTGGGSSFVLCLIHLGVMEKKAELQDSYRKPFSDLLNQHSHPPAHDIRLPYFHAPLPQAVALRFPAGVCLVTAHPCQRWHFRFKSPLMCWQRIPTLLFNQHKPFAWA